MALEKAAVAWFMGEGDSERLAGESTPNKRTAQSSHRRSTIVLMSVWWSRCGR